MSVHETGKGRWAVKWREGQRQRSYTAHSLEEAQILDLGIRKALREGHPTEVPSRRAAPERGSVLLEARAPTLEEYFFDPHQGVPSFYERRQAHLASRRLEAELWDRLIAPTLAQIPIHEITTVTIEDWRDDLLVGKSVGPSSVERAQKIIGKVLNDAARRGVIPFNPAAGARFILGSKKPIRPIQPGEAERIVARMELRDRMIVRTIQMTGIRPGELLGTGNSPGIRWSDFSVSESGCNSLSVKAGKTGQHRKIQILEPLQQDLDTYRSQVSSEPEAFMFPDPNGATWSISRYRNWRNRSWRNALHEAGLDWRRPYDLRHGFASLLLHEGRSIVYVARQLGNDPQVTSSTYAHIMDELEGRSMPVAAEEAIRRARREVSDG